jgi:hypothetical protein
MNDTKRIGRDTKSLLLSKRVPLLQRNIEENYIKHKRTLKGSKQV